MSQDTMLARMRRKVKGRVPASNAEVIRYSWLSDCWMNPKTTTPEQEDFVRHLRHFYQISTDWEKPSDPNMGNAFETLLHYPIDVVLSVADQMWYTAIGRAEHKFDTHYFGYIITLINIRRIHWPEEYAKKREEQFDGYLRYLYYTILNPTDRNERYNKTPTDLFMGKCPPAWWITQRVRSYTKQEFVEKRGYYMDRWTWEEPTEFNRYMENWIEKLLSDTQNDILEYFHEPMIYLSLMDYEDRLKMILAKS